MKSQDKYQIILADPAWSYRSGKNSHTSCEKHYKTMSESELVAMPVSEIAAGNSALFLWATGPTMPQAIELIGAWGFSYVTVAFTWVKTNKNGLPFMGMGYYTRGNAEFCLLGKRGLVQPVCRSINSAIITPKFRHSEKPIDVHARIESLFGETKRLELFARKHREGWDCTGLELTGHDYRSGIIC